MSLNKSEQTEKKWSLKETFLQMDRQQWIVILLTGVLLAVISLPVGKTDLASGGKTMSFGKASSEALNVGKTGGGSIFSTENADMTDTSGAEQTVLEKRLETLLSGAEGVGETRVMLMTREENGGDFYGRSDSQVTGVLVCAKGAGDPVIIQNIKEAVMALFQIEAHKIKVMKMK